jgi:hypothetical protein
MYLSNGDCWADHTITDMPLFIRKKFPPALLKNVEWSTPNIQSKSLAIGHAIINSNTIKTFTNLK